METDKTLYRVSDGTGPSVHACYDICPESPDGTRVVYFRFENDAPGPGDIVLHERQAGGHHTIGRSPRGTTHAGARQQWADPERVLWSEVDVVGPHVMVYALPGDTLQPLDGACDTVSAEHNRTLYHSSLLREFGWDPSEEAVWSLDLATGNVDTFIIREQALEAHPHVDGLVPEQMRFWHSRWSPDGSQLFVVFTNTLAASDNPGEVPQVTSLMLADADGTNLRYLWPCGEDPTWTPDGRSIHAHEYGPLRPEAGNPPAGHSREERGEQILVMRPLDGSEPTVLQRGPGRHSSLCPHGSRLITEVVQQDTAEIRLYEAPGDEPENYEVLVSYAAQKTGIHGHPAWSRDGERVYFNGRREGTVQLYCVEI